MNTGIRCAIFDFNGTLFFDFQENKDAWNEMALKYLGREFTTEELWSMMGKTDRLCAAYIFPDADDTKLDETSEEKEEIYLRMVKERGLELENDAVGAIREMKRRGVKVMICSSCPTMNMDWYKRNLGLTTLFDEKDIIAGRLDIPSKPRPDIYMYAIRESGFSGEECIAFEDAPGGLRAALGASFRRVYAVDSPGTDTALTSSMAPLVSWRWVLDHMDEVLA